MTGVMHGRGDAMVGVCMMGDAWQRGMHGGGGRHAWQGACVVGGLAWQGECEVGGMHGRQGVWRGGVHGRGVCVADTTRYGQ